MKRIGRRSITALVSLLMMFFLTSHAVYCADTTSTTDFTISVKNVFSLEFYTDPNVYYSSTVPFTNIDPREPVVYPDGRSEDDGKSDTAVICRSNAGTTWFLKIHTVAQPPLEGSLKYYFSQPFDRNTGAKAGGTLARSPDWYTIESEPTTIYTSGADDESNLPFGTLATFSFSLIPSKLEGGRGYSASITYTLTTGS